MAGPEPDAKQHFSPFYGTFRLSCAQPTGNSCCFIPKQWYRWKAKTLKVCLLLVWRVCVFGKRNVPKSGHVTITKIENLYVNTLIPLIPKMLFFSIYEEKQRSYRRKNRFRTVAPLGACGRLAVLS